MSTPYVGEIRLFAGNFEPVGWMFCHGQLLPIAENDVLFTLIGTTYGGDGQTTFALPDLRGRVPVHQGQGPGTSSRMLGEVGGVETVTLLASQMPAHTHALHANAAVATGTAPGGALLAATSVASYDTGPGATAMAASAVGSAGGNQPHQNMAPTVALNYIISLYGIFPSQG
ncbi:MULTISPECIES: phage tail protein [unclassified Roseateles]|uniref:phage tail protein n=1 Tax=unclassified Roseateles TaxID=2626991 RepID=UPI0007013BF7|nr:MULTISPECIES: tail fiber protein [unclassified Roseateles]KQW46369.1 phage tail protein [Pelomonas sp. Root405]KRA73419.1 phage tail protein [Pelomonas sp. Root662]